MAVYELSCEAATSAPVNTGAVVDDCTAAGGSVLWVEPGSVLPDLTLAEGGALATAFLALWAVAFAFRALSRQIRED